MKTPVLALTAVSYTHLDVYKRQTIIWVEHIMGVLMRVVDRVVVLDHGEKIFDGTPALAAVDPRVTEVYLGKGRP